MQNLNNKKALREFCSQKAIEVAAELVTLYCVENGSDDQAKKTLEISEFMAFVLGGKKLPDKDAPFHEKYADKFKILHGWTEDAAFFKE